MILFLASALWFPALKIRCVILTDVIQTAVNRCCCEAFTMVLVWCSNGYEMKSNSPILLARICVNLAPYKIRYSSYILRKEILLAWSIYQLGISHVAMRHIIRTLRKRDPYILHTQTSYYYETPTDLAGLHDVTAVYFFCVERKNTKKNHKNYPQKKSVWVCGKKG